jgi:hypothetical protein
MATSDETWRLTQAHLAAQLGIRAAVIRDIVRLFPMWNPFEIGSLDAFAGAVVLLAQKRSTDSAALAARYFQMYREVDLGLTAGKAMALMQPPSLAQIRQVISSTAVASFWRAIGNGLVTDEAKRLARESLSGGVGRLAMQGGRRTLTAAIAGDRYYRGRFMRVTDGNPCAFCAMMASRGPVYLSADSAGASRRWHDRCGCSIMPYSGGEWPQENTQMHEAWQAMKSQGGRDVKDFRRFLDGQPVDATVPRAAPIQRRPEMAPTAMRAADIIREIGLAQRVLRAATSEVERLVAASRIVRLQSMLIAHT